MQNVQPPPFVWPERLFLHLSDERIGFARYEAGADPAFVFSSVPYHSPTQTAEALLSACLSAPAAQGEARRVEVVVEGAVATVPISEFQEEDCEAYYDYCFPARPGQRRVMYDVVAPMNAVLVFALDEATCAAIESRYSSPHYTAALTSVARHFALRSQGPQGGGLRMMAYCREHYVDVMVAEGSNLLLMGTYEAQGPTDVAYYVLSAARATGFDLETMPIHVAGRTELRQAACEELRRFARTVLHLNPVAEYQRHVVAMEPDVPYDLVTRLLD